MPTPGGFDKNPHNIIPGRKKGAKNLATLLKERLAVKGEDGLTSAERIVNKLTEEAEAGNMRAFELLANRMEGLPRATIFTSEIPPLTIIDYGSNQKLPPDTGGEE